MHFLLLALLFVARPAVGIVTLSKSNLNQLCQVKPESISCANAQISLIQYETFYDYSKTLKTLDLSNNELGAIHPSTFTPLTELQSINLENNGIMGSTGLSGLTFTNQKKLTTLNMAYNMIDYLDFQTFQSQSELVSLDLSNNMLEKLPVRLFENLAKLNELHLGHNLLTELEPGTFKGLQQLAKLELNNNEINKVRALDLYCLKLTAITLCDNQIEFVDSSNCDSFQSLKKTWETKYNVKPSDCSSSTSVINASTNPATSRPITTRPTTSRPTTSRPTTSRPTTSRPTTSRPTTSRPTTSRPTTSRPITNRPTTSRPTTKTSPRRTTTNPRKTTKSDSTSTSRASSLNTVLFVLSVSLAFLF